MRIKSGFLVRKIAESYVAVPIKERTQTVSGIIALSETGAFIWKELEQDVSQEQLVSRLIEEYDVEQEQALHDVQSFIENLRAQRWLDEEVK